MKRMMKVFGWMAAAGMTVAAFAGMSVAGTGSTVRMSQLPDMVVMAERVADTPDLTIRNGMLPDILVIAETGTSYTVSRNIEGTDLPDVIVTAENSHAPVMAHTGKSTEQNTL